MSVELCLMTGHHLTAEEILAMPERLAHAEALRETARQLTEFVDRDTGRSPGGFQWHWKWEYEKSTGDIRQYWEIEGTDEDDGVYHSLTGPFGVLHFRKHVVEVYSWYRFSYFTRHERFRNVCLRFCTELARFFGQDQLLLYPDSMFPESCISDHTLPFDGTVTVAAQTYGAPRTPDETEGPLYYLVRADGDGR